LSEQRPGNQTAVRAALATISVVIVLAGCSADRIGGVDTLPPLPSPASTAPTTAPPTPQQQWYERHHQALTDQRNDIEVLPEQLATAPNPDATVMLCVAGQQAQRPEHEQARQAPDVHPAWAEAVDLTLWMVASCSTGSVSGVTAILTLLDDALARFDGWVTESATG
jgi:hypothetical protein